jgi:hypothetical protein
VRSNLERLAETARDYARGVKAPASLAITFVLFVSSTVRKYMRNQDWTPAAVPPRGELTSASLPVADDAACASGCSQLKKVTKMAASTAVRNSKATSTSIQNSARFTNFARHRQAQDHE